MKNRTLPKKLSLNRETVRLLEKNQLEGVMGGVTARCTLTNCGDSGCAYSCLCLAVAPTISGRASGQRRRAVRLRTASMRQQNISLPTVRKVLNGARSRALDRTSSRAFAASSRRTARALSSRVAPR